MIRVQSADFDVGLELKKLTEGNHQIGAVATFVGLVRDIADKDTISAMVLEHYPGMTERQLADIEHEANQRWDLNSSLIIHRYGHLEPGDNIVLVACASSHRENAFDACHFLIDWLKTKGPFWKFEKTKTSGHWVEALESDNLEEIKWGN